MAGDNRRVPEKGTGGRRGSRRTRESMEAAGLTDEGIALVGELIKVLDAKWSSHQEFVERVNNTEPKVRLDKKRLSKELGSSAKPKGPEWHIAELIVRHCVPDEAERRSLRARIAGLYCAARKVDRPPGYDGPIDRPSEGPDGAAAATAAVINRLQLELNKKITELLQLRALHDGMYSKLAELQAALDHKNGQVRVMQEELLAAAVTTESRMTDVENLTAQVVTLTSQSAAKDEEIGRVNELNDELTRQVTGKEAEIDRLTQEWLGQSAQHVKEQQRFRLALDDAYRVIAKQGDGIRDTAAVLAKYELQMRADAQRHHNLREQHARLAAQLELDAPSPSSHLAPPAYPAPPKKGRRETKPNSRWATPHGYGHDPRPTASAAVSRGSSPLWAQIDRSAPTPWRQLAVYLLVHQENCGQDTIRIAESIGTFHGEVERILTARTLPNIQLLDAVAIAVGAEITYARFLLAEAVDRPLRPWSESAPDVPASGVTGPAYVDDYESIVADLGGDNSWDTPAVPVPVTSVVAGLPGDNDQWSGDTGDNPATSADGVSPASGDFVVVAAQNDKLVPIRVGPSGAADDGGPVPVIYQSVNQRRYHQRQRRILRVVTGMSALLVSLIFAVIAVVVARPVAGTTIFLANLGACLVCWAIAATAHALFRRTRASYRGRHNPGRCSPKPAAVTGRAARPTTSGREAKVEQEERMPAEPAVEQVDDHHLEQVPNGKTTEVSPQTWLEDRGDDPPPALPPIGPQTPQEPQLRAQQFALVMDGLRVGIQQARGGSPAPDQKHRLDWLDD
jgi:hypothetical protein